ncbi:hypothetical protein F4804DRAFT_328506 [Jackrogersella minutella]|nr:hypothetical protein F4804DRAFT_328506 [Jackrogersella minutella]
MHIFARRLSLDDRSWGSKQPASTLISVDYALKITSGMVADTNSRYTLFPAIPRTYQCSRKDISRPRHVEFHCCQQRPLGEGIRPAEALTLANTVGVPGIVARPCPSEKLLKFHTHGLFTLPYLGLYACLYGNFEGADTTVESIERYDADGRVLVRASIKSNQSNLKPYLICSSQVKYQKKRKYLTFLTT